MPTCSLEFKKMANGSRISRRERAKRCWPDARVGQTLAIAAFLDLQSSCLTKDAENVPTVFPLFQSALINRVVR